MSEETFDNIMREFKEESDLNKIKGVRQRNLFLKTLKIEE